MTVCRWLYNAHNLSTKTPCKIICCYCGNKWNEMKWNVCDMTLHFNVYLSLSKWKMDMVICVYIFLNKEMTQTKTQTWSTKLQHRNKHRFIHGFSWPKWTEKKHIILSLLTKYELLWYIIFKITTNYYLGGNSYSEAIHTWQYGHEDDRWHKHPVLPGCHLGIS